LVASDATASPTTATATASAPDYDALEVDAPGDDAPGDDAPAERGLWQEAFDRLPQKTRQTLFSVSGAPDPEQRPIEQQIEDLVENAKKLQKQCEEEFWIVGGHRLRDNIASIIKCLTQIGDIAIQFAPTQASKPWSAVKALMQVGYSLTHNSSVKMSDTFQ
jgi:ankyrin repeat domain-containing protein 50